MSVSAFLSDVRRCAAALPPGKHVVNCCQDRYWFAVTFAAAVLRGQISLLTADHSARSLEALAARYGDVHAVSEDPGFSMTLPLHVIGPGEAQADRATDVPLIPAAQVAAIVFTSGSSGEPVGTPKRFGELAARSIAAGLRFGFSRNDPLTLLGTVPPHHMYGFETTVLLPLHAPASSWCGPLFYPADVAAALAEVPGCSVLVTTPLQLRAMLQAPPPVRPPSLVISATAPLDADLAERAENLWQADVMEIFGATEVGSIASRRTTAGPVWSIYPGVSLSGQESPLVHARGAVPRRFDDVIDLADDRRHFRLLSRCGDMVKLGGRRASLAGLTRALNQLDGVEDGVFLAPDDIDKSPTARLLALVVSPQRSVEDILEALRGQIDPIFLPRPLMRVASLPRNALGKLPREAVLAIARNRREKAVLF